MHVSANPVKYAQALSKTYLRRGGAACVVGAKLRMTRACTFFGCGHIAEGGRVAPLPCDNSNLADTTGAMHE